MAPSAASSVAVGSVVWVEDDEEAWVEAEVVAVEKKKATVKTPKGDELVVRIKHCHPKDMDAPSGGVDDMTKLSYLHEPGVLHNLYSRYLLDEIYTYTGQILIAVNPFQSLPHLYNEHMMEQYKGVRLGELSPHVFAIAEAAFRAMLDYGHSQSILVSGESGAGKTETTKLIMQYLAHMGGRAAADGRTVESQVLESNPLLEAFGNAKTVRNNNSSRFGKFVEIQFDRLGRISGAAVRTYLLERSRVVQISDPERNYHCFYQICAGASPEEREELRLGPPESYHYLNQSSCMEIPGKDSNAAEYVKTRRAMDVVGLTPEEQDSIFRVVAAVLHLGNITFQPGKQPDSSKISGDTPKYHLDAVAHLLRVDKKQLRESLITRTLVTREGNIKRDLNPDASLISRDTLAKTLYARLFDWLVDKVNKSIGQDPDRASIIGVLDIYGFETFEINSFEQFCINLANEKLQQHFNQHVFKSEQEEYEREEIQWSYIEFVDNQDVLELIEKKPMGIIALLDEQCMFPKSTPETFATKLYQTLGAHQRFEKPKLSQTDFTIDHYAGKVTYDTNLFLDKNKDYVVMEHQDLLSTSKDPFVAALFPLAEGGEKVKSKFTSLGSSFKQQLADLMATLNTTEPHYIRCVKPNSKNRAGLFQNHNVLHQLRCGGVLEAIRISCAGYPTRKTFDEFLDRFSMLAPDVVAASSDEKTAVTALLEKLGLTNFQVGKTKVFLRAGQMADLDVLRTEKLGNAARVIQRGVRTCLLRRQFILMRRAAVKAQAIWRGKMARAKYQSMRRERAAVCIQKWVRQAIARAHYMTTRRATITIQSAVRGHAARKLYRKLRREKCATAIQAAYRRHAAQKRYTAMRKSALVMQCMWRGRKARLELKQLKWDAKQTGALQEAKTKLEKQCEELTWRLQLEKRMRADLEETKEKQDREMEKLKQELEEVKSHLTKTRSELHTMEKQLQQGGGAAASPAPAAAAATAASQDAGTGSPGSGQSEPVIKTVVKEVVRVVRVPMSAEEAAAAAAAGESVDAAAASAAAAGGTIDVSSAALAVEVAKLKELLESSEARTSAQVAAVEAEKVKQLRALGDSMNQLREEYGRMEEQMKILEQENQILRKQAISSTAVGVLAAQDMVTPRSPAASPPLGPRGMPSAVPPSASSHHAAVAAGGGAVPPSPAPGLASPVASMTPVQAGVAAAHHRPSGTVPPTPESPSMFASPLSTEMDHRRHRAVLDRQQADQDALLQFIVTDLGFDNNRPLAACLLYKALLHWRSFEAERTNVFDRVIQTIGHAIESGPDSSGSVGSSSSNDRLAYWLANAATLLHLLQRSLRPGGVHGGAHAGSQLQRRSSRAAASTSFLSRMTQSFRASTDMPLAAAAAAAASHGDGVPSTPGGRGGVAGAAGGAAGGGDGVVQVDAKYPALLFKQQLTAYVEKLFGCIRDNLKKEISPMLQLCIQAPRTSRVSFGGRPGQRAAMAERGGGGSTTPLGPTGSTGGGHGMPAVLNQHWVLIISKLTDLLSTLKANHVPSFLIRRLFTQIFSFINVQLFNSLLLRRECCSFSNGEYVKAGLAELERWIMDAGDKYAGTAWEELKYIRQAVGFLVIHQKPKKSFEDITADLCPALTTQQLYRISTMYWDDKYGTHSVSAEVIAAMRARMTEEAAAAQSPSNSFLLDDDSSIPFSVDDMQKNLPNISLNNLSAPPHLRGSGSFVHLFS